ncbi:mechanosensitive ion channel family protein [Psychromarinibacter sp. S121]|uniref:mechanosensitive ion channel family protein n=1 Tax=Psychromarinibacter sp. S121 TaxID=3415127 RepID=UPI003C7DD964
MEQEFQSFVTMLTELWTMLVAQSRNLLLPSRLTQIAILLVCAVVAWGLGRATSPRMRAWMRELEGWPKWRLRFLLLIEKRLWLIYFILLSWLSVAVMRMITTFPSRRYILALIASIATAWLIVSLTTRLVRNPLLRRFVSWGLWIWVTLYFLGLTDEASEILDGLAIQFGDFRLSALAILKALVVTALLFTLARMLAGTTSARIRRNDDISPSMQVLLVKVVQIVLFSAAFFIGLKAVGFDLTGLAVLSGAVGVGLGFGLQKVVSNLVSGVIILLDKSVKPGDVISLGETFGWITALGARYVSITTRDGKEYLIPNEDLITGQVVNWSHQNDFVRLDIFFGTAYADDPHVVRKVAIEAAMGVNRVLKDRPPVCHIVGFGDSSVDYILRFWITDPTGGLTNIRGNVYLALWDAFKEHGISIPFPQREVKVLEGSTLVTAPARASSESGFAGD